MNGALALSSSVVLGSSAQILLKRGSAAFKTETGLRRFLSVWMLGWAICFLVATGLWMIALKQLDISYAYPLLGLGYVLVVILADRFLHESVTPLRWFAITVISTGAILIAGSK